MSNTFTAIVNLGADPEELTLGTRQVYKLRCADKGIGKDAVTFWFTALVGGPDITTAQRLIKGDSIAITGTLVHKEYRPKKPRYKGEMMTSAEVPFAKIMQVVKSDTFFNRDVGDMPGAAGDAPTASNDGVELPGGDASVEPAELEGL